MSWRSILVVWCGGLTLAVALAAAEAPPKLEELRLEAFEPIAGRAVFRSTDGRLVAVDERQALAARGAVLLEVLVDRVVIERDSPQPGIRETVWMFPATERGKPSRLQILSQILPESSDPPTPFTHSVEVPVEPPTSPPPS